MQYNLVPPENLIQKLVSVIDTSTPGPAPPVRSASHSSLTQTHLLHFCNHDRLCCIKRRYICLCAVAFQSAFACPWLRRALGLPGSFLRQESGLQEESAAPLICDVVPDWAKSHFRLAWSSTAHALRERCQKVSVSAERQNMSPKNKFERLQTKTRDCQAPSQDATNPPQKTPKQ